MAERLSSYRKITEYIESHRYSLSLMSMPPITMAILGEGPNVNTLVKVAGVAAYSFSAYKLGRYMDTHPRSQELASIEPTIKSESESTVNFSNISSKVTGIESVTNTLEAGQLLRSSDAPSENTG